MPTHLGSSEVLASWELGWDALVAIGTLLLAGVTFLLVLRTAALAKFSETDIRAQWRPIILPASYDPDGSALFYTNGVLYVGIKNAGRGPALYPDSTDDLIVSGDLVRVGRRGGLELG
jgi:hypothetical protein